MQLLKRKIYIYIIPRLFLLLLDLNKRTINQKNLRKIKVSTLHLRPRTSILLCDRAKLRSNPCLSKRKKDHDRRGHASIRQPVQYFTVDRSEAAQQTAVSQPISRTRFVGTGIPGGQVSVEIVARITRSTRRGCARNFAAWMRHRSIERAKGGLDGG